MQNGGNEVLKEYEEHKTLSEQKRHKLVNLLADMLVAKHGLYPKSCDKTALAKTAISLFPNFKVSDTKHGTVYIKQCVI